MPILSAAAPGLTLTSRPVLKTALLALAMFVVAVLYSSVGHAGASGYLAVMALAGTSAAVMKPTALVLNLLVASIGTARFVQAKAVPWNLLWPFAITSIPAAFIGGAVGLPGDVYKRLADFEFHRLRHVTEEDRRALAMLRA